MVSWKDAIGFGFSVASMFFVVLVSFVFGVRCEYADLLAKQTLDVAASPI